MTAPCIADAKLIDLPRHPRDDGVLVVAEAMAQVPFAIGRVFTLRAAQGNRRGRHAHRRCSQFMLCASGVVDVAVDDGTARQVFSLEHDNQALFLPPMLWAEVVFRVSSLLIVLCDRPYEAEDYIADYDIYRAAQQGAAR